MSNQLDAHRSPTLIRYSLIVLVFCYFASNLYGQEGAFQEYKRTLQGKGQSLVDEVRKRNGILAAPSFAKKLVDTMLGGCFEESPVDFLIVRDFPAIDAALIDTREDSEKPVIVVIYRKGYAEANPQLLERLIRSVTTNGNFTFKVSYEDFSQLASVYVLGGTGMQIFDVRQVDGAFGVYKRDEASVVGKP